MTPFLVANDRSRLHLVSELYEIFAWRLIKLVTNMNAGNIMFDQVSDIFVVPKKWLPLTKTRLA
jgi:hypothetical protein